MCACFLLLFLFFDLNLRCAKPLACKMQRFHRFEFQRGGPKMGEDGAALGGFAGCVYSPHSRVENECESEEPPHCNHRRRRPRPSHLQPPPALSAGQRHPLSDTHTHTAPMCDPPTVGAMASSCFSTSLCMSTPSLALFSNSLDHAYLCTCIRTRTHTVNTQIMKFV